MSLLIRNLDFDNWKVPMAPEGDPPKAADARSVTRPRPGHADLAGALKYGTRDARDILERASARETAARTAAGIRRTLSVVAGGDPGHQPHARGG